MQPGETICMWPVRAAGASLAVVGLIRSLSRVSMTPGTSPTQATPRPVLRDRERGSRRVGRETSSCLPRPTGARTVAPNAVASDHEGR
jgi:hypothetical protein